MPGVLNKVPTSHPMRTDNRINIPVYGWDKKKDTELERLIWFEKHEVAFVDSSITKYHVINENNWKVIPKRNSSMVTFEDIYS